MKIDLQNIKNNELLRQFEFRFEDKLLKVEYSEQGRNLFLTRFEMDKNIKEEQLKNLFLKTVLDHLSDEGMLVVPTCPIVAAFFRKHKADYKHLLPVGINL